MCHLGRIFVVTSALLMFLIATSLLAQSAPTSTNGPDFSALQQQAQAGDTNAQTRLRRNSTAEQPPTQPSDLGLLTVNEAHPIDSRTDMHRLTGADILWLLKHAEGVRIEPPSRDEQKMHKKWYKLDWEAVAICSGERGASAVYEGACEKAADLYEYSVDGNGKLHSTTPNNPKRFEALIRYCDWAAKTQSANPGCGKLGTALLDIGNINAGRAVLKYAPGCHTRREDGQPINGCFLTAAYGVSERETKLLDSDLLLIAESACNNDLDTAGCEYALSHSGKIGFTQEQVNEIDAARNRADQALLDRLKQQAAQEALETEERQQEKEDRFGEVLGALRSLPGGNDPNAIVNAGNQQAAQIQAVGAANDAARQQAAQARAAAQQAATQAAQQAQLDQAQARQQQQQATAAQQTAQQQAQQGPAVTDGELIRTTNSPSVYVVQGGQRHLIPDTATLAAKWGGVLVYTISQSAMDAIPVGDSIQPVFCSGVASPTQPPPHKDPVWGPWQLLGNTGVAVSVSRVDSKTLTWEFFNGRPDRVTSLNFNYSYVDADSGQNTTQKDVVPVTLKPGDALGGWTAYTANTRGSINIVITQMSCQ